MGWQAKHGEAPAYYRSKRQNGRVVTEYIGTATLGELAAEIDMLRRAERKLDARAQQQEAREWKKADAKLNYFNIGIDDDGATVKFIADTVVDAMAPEAEIKYGRGNKGWVGDVPHVRYSIAKLEALGWQPALSSEDATKKAVTEQLEG